MEGDMFRVAAFALLLVGLGSQALANTDSSVDTRQIVTDLAFDPAKFFGDDRGQDLIRFTYTGDDYGWPVYAIAIRSGCLGTPTPNCNLERRARMVRAPAIENMERPRWRGRALIGKVDAQKPKHPKDVASILGTVGMEWVECDDGSGGRQQSGLG
jgi:hypothetical protein